jgi:penicillin-insensitive murein DD-endopeptidase
VLAAESTCYGTVSNGRLENGVALPSGGANFSSYSSLAATLGRTYVHSKVEAIVVATYAALQKTAPTKVFVYGETGWASGGRFRPHRTHQNGLSVDFMVPVTDRTGKSVPLPTGVRNKWGYNIEFDANAKFGEYSIDFEALAEHLYQLQAIAKAQGMEIGLVILDPLFLHKLFATKHGPYLEQNLSFMRGKSWWRHDEHYHIDFVVPCKPITG